MPKAKEVAAELRRLAESLEREPDAVVEQPLIAFYSHGNKDSFFNLAHLLPRPLVKSDAGSETFPAFRLEYKSAGAWILAEVYKEAACTILEPAKPAVYRCDPILSLDEEEAISL